VTPVRFEAEYGALWRELESALDEIERGRPERSHYDRGAGGAARPLRAPVGPARCCAVPTLLRAPVARPARAYPIA